MEHLLDEAVDGSTLALNITMARLAMRDLNILLKFSDLKKGDELINKLESVVDHAKKAGRGLQKFNVKVGSAVDR
jgi:hypothetical protein